MHQAPPDFSSLLRQRGLRATPGRVALLAALWKAPTPRSVHSLSRAVGLNIVTVYRALSDLVTTGLVIKGVSTGSRMSANERDMHASLFSYAKHHHHHHLVCRDCGFIQNCARCA